MAELVALYKRYPELSLRRFAEAVGVAYYRLRDFIRSEQQRRKRQQREQALRQAIKKVALEYPTYGYRPLYQELKAHGVKVGREKVRRLLGELGLTPAPVRRRRNPAPEVTAAPDYPPGRRLQIDATQVTVTGGKVWVYLVQDVPSRACLAVRVVRSLSKQAARAVLHEGVRVLRQLGFYEPLVIQSDAGSDFTSALFQWCCQDIGCWVRSKVNQRGGMGILERLNRTFKHQWLFRHEFSTLPEVQHLADRFKTWYNQQRRHSTLNYATPWSALVQSVTLSLTPT